MEGPQSAFVRVGGKPRAPSGRSGDALLGGPISWKYNERTVIHLSTEHLSTCVEKSFLHRRDPYFVEPSNTKKEQRVKCPNFEKRKKGQKGQSMAGFEPAALSCDDYS